METMELGSSPWGENCAQVGSDDYDNRAKKECRAWINQLRRAFPNPPEGVRFFIKSNSHDFGYYYEVAIKFDENDVKQADYAYNVEANSPENWDDIAKSELSGIQKVFVLVPVEISMKTEEQQILNVNVDYGIIFNAASKAVAKGDFFPYNPLEK